MNFTGRRVEEPTNQRMRFPSVAKYMATHELTLSSDTTINEAIDIILKQKVTGAPVLGEDRKIMGMLSEKDCLKLLLESAYNNMPFHDKTVVSYMSPVVKTVSTDHDILDVAQEFLTSNYRKFPVVDNGRLVGQISRRDILRAIRELREVT